MNKFTVYLSREYIVQIEADNEDDARNFTELYVSGGFDDSSEATRKQDNFQIRHIKPTLNEAFYVEKIKS
ncbi:MAG TPA: hypothetical protein DCQ26_16860 [Marinilabiliales bacterium]|nr:MAG: hypothetical protein A2W84_06650 [Bacteroidetes bacterium GWC2_40_13]OFX70943.1 MAG: hypothetical protein A2W96_07450 [Bacteroidetes bacterium GWD2_40_43]OFX88425.1 MAG: hypothetical protein A2W97_09390 [Bacteroidetes bacterium GWE2_40_63]OFY23354.1 MAG: hypothetical protein A2W88_10660 [Bacteroidetes bacterium GWF2_40_13]OFZ29602.1 MAG: hypothetical protein A2437_08880 [Bacteroidetes bacterium RIFOXYC2_FULL_40_12]HAN00266.1 hypothetical protein [Marinilabiliales bacterium]